MVRLTGSAPPSFDWLNGDVATLRRHYERLRAKPVPPDARWVNAARVDVLHFPGQDVGNAAIVYFHGGGFIVGSPVTHADIAMRLVRCTGLPVYSVAYRLAPEHRAPAPVEDGIAVIDHLLSAGARQLIICGDSAGGAIALAVEARLAEVQRNRIICVASFYGAHGLVDTPSMRERGSRADGTDRACVERYFELAGPNIYSIEAVARNSPVPVYLMAAEDDALRDDTMILAQALEQKGRLVTLDRVFGADHGFLHGGESNGVAEQAITRFAACLPPAPS